MDNYRDLQCAIDTGEAAGRAGAAPRFRRRRTASGPRVPLQFIVDGSDANTATIVLGYAATIAQSYSQDLAVGGPPQRRSRPRNALGSAAAVWFNEDLEGKNYIVPGLIAVIMMVIAALLTSLHRPGVERAPWNNSFPRRSRATSDPRQAGSLFHHRHARHGRWRW